MNTREELKAHVITCMEGYIQIMRQTIKNHGVPHSLYADGLSLFFQHKRTND
jgi:hypothetical protein